MCSAYISWCSFTCEFTAYAIYHFNQTRAFLIQRCIKQAAEQQHINTPHPPRRQLPCSPAIHQPKLRQ